KLHPNNSVGGIYGHRDEKIYIRNLYKIPVFPFLPDSYFRKVIGIQVHVKKTFQIPATELLHESHKIPGVNQVTVGKALVRQKRPQHGKKKFIPKYKPKGMYYIGSFGIDFRMISLIRSSIFRSHYGLFIWDGPCDRVDFLLIGIFTP